MKNILVAVSGLTPQIITETLFVLTKKHKIQIDEIIVITTERGKDIILGKDKEYNHKKKYPKLKSEIQNLCEQYKIKIPRIEKIFTANEQSVELYDIRNDSHNKLFPNKVCEVIKSLTADNDNVLHCSISGGRKTMSVDLAFALSIFGRLNDKLYHVLIDEKFEFKYFYPKTKSQEKMLEMSEIPYIRLRSLLGKETNNKFVKSMCYIDIVKHLQKELKLVYSDILTINVRRGELYFGENEIIKIQPAQTKLYKSIIQNSHPDEGMSLDRLLDLQYGKFDSMKSINRKSEKQNETNLRALITKVNNIIKEAISDVTLIPEFIIDRIGKDDDRMGIYSVRASREKIKIID